MLDFDAMSATEIAADSAQQSDASRARYSGQPLPAQRSPAPQQPPAAPVETRTVAVLVRAGRPAAIWRNADTATVPLLSTLLGLRHRDDAIVLDVELTDGTRWSLTLADGEPWADDVEAYRAHPRATGFELAVVATPASDGRSERWMFRSTDTDAILGFPTFPGLPADQRHDLPRLGRP